MTRASDTAKLLGAGATILDGTTISTADNDPQLILKCTDTDASTGPKLDLERNPGEAGADGDNLAQINFYGYNDASEKTQYLYLFAEAADVANGSEDVRFGFGGLVAGADSSLMTFMHGTSATGADPEMVFNDSSKDINFRVESDGNANMLFVDGGNNKVGINDSLPVGLLSVKGGDSGVTAATSYANELVIENNTNGGITFNCGASNSSTILFQNSSNAEDGQIAYRNSEREMRFNVAGAEKFRMEGNGRLIIGKTTNNSAVAGVVLETGQSAFTRDGGQVILFNRHTNDGSIIGLGQNDATEGTISVSGSTVSYNAFSGSHWSRLADNSKPTILKGTVIETIDEMCDWYQAQFTIAATTEKNVHDETVESTPETIKRVSIALPSGKSVGDTLSYTYEGITYDNAVIVKENDNKHAKCKISDTADSKRVYGVYADWDADDDSVNDMYVTALGTHVVRINKDVTVTAGDLLSSNGDGTAKVQDDDIIRSKTIGKVLTNIKQETYDDGSYTVPCALYCG